MRPAPPELPSLRLWLTSHRTIHFCAGGTEASGTERRQRAAERSDGEVERPQVEDHQSGTGAE